MQTFDGSYHNHWEMARWEEFGRMGDSIIDLLTPINLLHCSQNQFHRKELHYLVSYVKWGVEHHIPSWGKEFRLKRIHVHTHCPK